MLVSHYTQAPDTGKASSLQGITYLWLTEEPWSAPPRGEMGRGAGGLRVGRVSHMLL